jgi:hypothetical protein
VPIPVDVVELAADGLAVEGLVESGAAGHGARVDGFGGDVETAIWTDTVGEERFWGFGGS